MNKFFNFCARAIAVIALLVSGLQVFAEVHKHPDDYYPPYLYIDGMVNGADYWNAFSYYDGKHIKVPHSGNGVYYALLIRPGGTQVNISGSIADAHGSPGGGRFRITYPDIDENGMQYTVTDRVSGESSDREHLKTIDVACSTSDTELTQGTEYSLVLLDPAINRPSFFVKENAIADYQTKRIFMVKIDLKNKKIKWLTDGDSENKPHTWWVAHTGSSISSFPQLKEYNGTANWEKGNGGFGRYDFSEPMHETSTPGVFEAKYVWLPQIADTIPGGTISDWRKSYFRMTAIPSYRPNYTTADAISWSDPKYRMAPSTEYPEISYQFTYLGETANVSPNGNVFKIQAGNEAIGKKELYRGYYNLTLNTNNNTLTINKGIPENLWIYGTVNDMAGWDYVNGWKTNKLDKGSEGIFYGTIRRNGSSGYTFTFTDRNVETGSQKVNDFNIHRINGGTPSQPITIAATGTEAVCKGDVDLSNSSYQIRNSDINFAYAKVDMNNDKVTFSTTPNLMFINYNGATTRMEQVENGWKTTVTPVAGKLIFNFCTMSSEPDKDLFGPATDANLNVNTSANMVAHTAGGKYTVTVPATAQNIDYDVFVTLENDTYKVYVGVSKFYVYGNSDQKVKAGSGWRINNDSPLTMVAPGIYKATHVYLTAEYNWPSDKSEAQPWGGKVWKGTYWKPYTYFWFTATPNGAKTDYSLRPNNVAAGENVRFVNTDDELSPSAYNKPFYLMTDNASDYKVFMTFPGHYDITVDMNNSNLNVQRTIPETLVLKGNGNVKNQDAPLYSVGNGHYTGVINTNAASFPSGTPFWFEDEKGHKYGPESANTELNSTTIGNKFLFSEQTHLDDNNNAGGGGSYKIMEGFNGAIYVDCDFNNRTMTFSTTPLAMAARIGGNHLIPMVLEEDGKFHLRNCAIGGNIFFSTRLDKVDGPVTNYFGDPTSPTVVSGTEYTATARSSSSYKNNFPLFDITFDPKTNKVVVTDLSANNQGATSSKVILANTTRTTFRNPISQYSIADPTIVRDDNGKFHTLGTGGYYYTSDDLIHFKYEGRLADMYTQGAAAKAYMEQYYTTSNGTFWAPDMTRIAPNKYVAFYSVSNRTGDKDKSGNTPQGGTVSAIGVKTATNPAGPWTDNGLLFTKHNSNIYNCIDAQLFIDSDGRKYVVDGSYKNGGISNGGVEGIFIMELNDECTAIKAGDNGLNSKVRIAKGSFEGSYIYKRNGWYYYFGSCGNYGANNTTIAVKDLYRLIVARSKNLYGPYILPNGKAIMDFDLSGRTDDGLGDPFLYSNVVNTTERGRFVAPGHNGEIITDDEGKYWMIYHGYDTEDYDTGRKLFMDQVVWENDWPRIYWADPETGTKHYGEPSYKEVEGPVFYPITKSPELVKDGDKYTAADVNINSGDPSLVRVFEVRGQNWCSEWNMYYRSFGAAELTSNYLKSNVASNMKEASTAASCFTTSTGVYDAEATINDTSKTGTLKLIRKQAGYPDRLYMIGNMNTKFPAKGWEPSYKSPILMHQDAQNPAKYYTDIYISANSNQEVTWAFTTLKSADAQFCNEKRYGPTDRVYDFNANGAAATFTTACVPDANAEEKCYRMNRSGATDAQKFEQGAYHVTVDLENGTMTLTKKDDSHNYPGGLYLVHGATVLPSGEEKDWNFTTNECHMLKQTSEGVYEAKGVVLPMERSDNRRSYFAITSAVSVSGDLRDIFWGTTYGGATQTFPYDRAVNGQDPEDQIPNLWINDATNYKQSQTRNIVPTSSFFSAVPGIYDLTVNLKNGTITLAPTTTYPDNLYIVGNCDYVTRDATAAGRIKMYNAGNGKYYGLVNKTAAEAGTFMFTASEEDNEQDMSCCTFGSVAPETAIAIGNEYDLYGVSRYVTKYYNNEEKNYGYYSDFNYKASADGKYYVEVDLAACKLKVSDKPSVLYIVRSYSDAEADIVPNGWNWLMNGEQGVLLRQPDSSIDLKTPEPVNMPAEHGGTNSTYSLSGIAVPEIYTQDQAWKIVKIYRLGNGLTEANNTGTWGNVVNILSNGREKMKNTGAGTFHLAFNYALQSLVRLDAAKDYTGVCLLNLHKGTDQSDEGFKDSNYDMRGWMAMKYDDNTYYFENIHSNPIHLVNSGDNKCRFTFLIDGKYQICADEGTVLDPTANATDRWRVGHIGEAAVTANSKGLFNVNAGTYYGLTVKKVSDTEWKIGASTHNLGMRTSKVNPALGADYVVRQSELVSWNDKTTETTKFDIKLKNTSTKAPVGNQINITNDATNVNLYGLYSGSKLGLNNHNAMLRATHANGVEEIAICGLSKTADVTTFTNGGGVTVNDGLTLKSDEQGANNKLYGANLAWSFSDQTVLPSYYTLRIHDEVTGNDVFPTFDGKVDTEEHKATLTEMGGRIRGGADAGYSIGTCTTQSVDSWRAVYIDNIQWLGANDQGNCQIKFVLRPKYVIFTPSEITADPSLRTNGARKQTSARRTKAADFSSPIINPDELVATEYTIVDGDDLVSAVVEFSRDDEPTSIDDILNNANTFIVIGGQGFVKVQGENVDVVEIYSVGGIRLASHVGACEIPLAAGTYVVRVNNTTTKVIVK